MRLTVGLSLAGVPVAVVPCGFVDGLPVAMQLIGADWSEPLLLSVASAFQRSTDWHERRPDTTRVAGGRK
jgi:aspartyl-tRNA(Asn)/glutamyl-tRNA(Gln) amidotransferase subunit A